MRKNIYVCTLCLSQQFYFSQVFLGYSNRTYTDFRSKNTQRKVGPYSRKRVDTQIR